MHMSYQTKGLPKFVIGHGDLNFVKVYDNDYFKRYTIN